MIDIALTVAAVRDWLGGGTAPPQQKSGRLPVELMAAIDAAAVTFRPTPDSEGGERVYVSVATVGFFRFDGIEEAAARILNAWPEISAPQARHAASLIAGLIGRRNLEYARGMAPRRRSWMNSCGAYDLDRL